MTAKIIVVGNQKGGVGKTTTVINLGAALAERKHSVLLVDLDPQGALSAGLGIDPRPLTETIYQALMYPAFDISRLIIGTEAGCDLVPANIDLANAETRLINEVGRERILGKKLAPVVKNYEFILIDCPPSLSVLTINALAAATWAILPVQTEYFALRGMDALLDTITTVHDRINDKLHVLGILPTLHDPRTNQSRDALEELQQNYRQMLFKTVIPRTVKIADSATAGQSILTYSPQSPAGDAYRKLAGEVIKRA